MKNREKGGIILWIVLIVAGLGLLKYFLNWDIFDAAASNQGRSTIGYLRQIFNTIWGVIGYPVTWTWVYIVHPLLNVVWNNFMSFIHWGQDVASQPTPVGDYGFPVQ